VEGIDSSATNIAYKTMRADSKNNKLVIQQALLYDFDGKVLDPNGVEIDRPFWLFKRLRRFSQTKI
jgi:hypothetical protein